jgi:ABC-type glycerol-3-phosphate transport system permease component
MGAGAALKSIIRYLLVLVLLLAIGAPFVWMVLSSLQPNAELIRPGNFFSWSAMTFDNYLRLPSATHYLLLGGNSLLVALFSTAIAIPLALLAAYSVFRTHYRGRTVVYNLLLVVYIFPGVLLLAPLFGIFAAVGLLNSWASLVIMNVTFAVPFSVWLMRGFFTSIPAGIEEAAAIDGATDMQILTKVIVPLTAPGIVVTATYTFVLSWTEFMFASVFIVDDRLKTLPVGLEALVSQYSIDWGLLSAAAVAAALPVVVIFAFAGRYFVEGITSGAGK